MSEQFKDLNGTLLAVNEGFHGADGAVTIIGFPEGGALLKQFAIRLSLVQATQLIGAITRVAERVQPQPSIAARLPGQAGKFIERAWEILDGHLADIRANGLPPPTIGNMARHGR